MAQEETGFGVAAHKKLKNEFGSRRVWESIRDLRTVGVLRHDPERRLYEIAMPIGRGGRPGALHQPHFHRLLQVPHCCQIAQRHHPRSPSLGGALHLRGSPDHGPG